MKIMKIADTDTTYCINEKCAKKCWRYKDNWYFEKDINYWFIEKCERCEKWFFFIKRLNFTHNKRRKYERKYRKQ